MVSPQFLPISVTVGTVVVKFKLYSSGNVLTDDATLTALKQHQRLQYQGLLSNTTIPYISFNGFGVKFNQGIIINCWGEGGIKINSNQTLYDYIAVTIHTNQREWV